MQSPLPLYAARGFAIGTFLRHFWRIGSFLFCARLLALHKVSCFAQVFLFCAKLPAMHKALCYVLMWWCAVAHIFGAALTTATTFLCVALKLRRSRPLLLIVVLSCVCRLFLLLSSVFTALLSSQEAPCYALVWWCAVGAHLWGRSYNSDHFSMCGPETPAQPAPSSNSGFTLCLQTFLHCMALLSPHRPTLLALCGPASTAPTAGCLSATDCCGKCWVTASFATQRRISCGKQRCRARFATRERLEQQGTDNRLLFIVANVGLQLYLPHKGGFRVANRGAEPDLPHDRVGGAGSGGL